MSLSRFEATADYLNEMKRRKEQCCIVQYLNTRVSGLPFKLVDSKRWLYRQDVVTALVSVLSMYVRGLLCRFYSNGRLIPRLLNGSYTGFPLRSLGMSLLCVWLTWLMFCMVKVVDGISMFVLRLLCAYTQNCIIYLLYGSNLFC